MKYLLSMIAATMLMASLGSTAANAWDGDRHGYGHGRGNGHYKHWHGHPVRYVAPPPRVVYQPVYYRPAPVYYEPYYVPVRNVQSYNRSDFSFWFFD